MSAGSSALAGRRAAEALMVDACTVRTEPTTKWDEGEGENVTTPGAIVYQGRCRVQVPNVTERDTGAGDADWTVQAAIVSLPVDGSEAVEVGHVVTVDTATLDAALDGAEYTVVGLHRKTHATARRLRCQEVTS